MIALALLGLMSVTQISLRGGEATPPGSVSSVDPAGVVISAPGAAPIAIGWDRIRLVEGEWAAKAEPFLPVADLAWRARTRLERGDSFSAEPLFEQLFETYRGQSGATAAVVAEGLLRCRLRRGAHIAAIEPWLATLTASPPGVQVLHASWASDAGLLPAVDAVTGLVPALPPVWLAWPSVEAFARQTPAPSGDPRSDGLRAMFLAAAQFECGQELKLPPAAANDIGSQIVRDIVLARAGTPDQRAAARKSLIDRLRGTPNSPTPAWMEAWYRAAIGRSLLREASPEQRQLGVVELLHLPARFSGMHPYLAGVALAEASVALREMGDAPGADTLARELAEGYTSHPALEWPKFRMAAPVRRTVATQERTPR
jgi:hypothetical protein